MLNVAVLVSGSGSNLQAILDANIKGINIVTVVSSKLGAYALERARLQDIPTAVFCKNDFENQVEMDRELVKYLKKYSVDLIVMAGYLNICSAELVFAYKGKIINIHPSLIPAFCGKGYYGIKVHKAVLDYGVKITGATVHYVTEGCDEGPILLQKAVNVESGDTPEILAKRVLEVAEHKLIVEALKLLVYMEENNEEGDN